MGEVIEFPDAHDPTMDNRKRREVEDRRRQQEMDRISHGQRIRRRLEESRPWPLRPTEQEEVARALYAVLERTSRNHGIRKASVLREAGLKSEGDPTKHLSQYTLPPHPADNAARRGRLRKKAEPYARIAKAAASLAGLDEDSVLGEVFAAASPEASSRVDADIEKYEELARVLRTGVEGIARRLNLQDYFLAVQKSGLRATAERNPDAVAKSLSLLSSHDVNVIFDRGGPYDWDISFRRPTAQQFCENDEAIVCYPSISIGMWHIGDPVPIHVSVEPEGEVGSPSKIELRAHYVAELRLCIVPLQPDLRPEPALRVALRATVDSLPVQTEHSGVTKPTDIIQAGQPSRPESGFRNYWHLPVQVGAEIYHDEFGNCRVDSIERPLPDLVRRYFGDASGKSPQFDGVRFFPVDGQVLHDWLGFSYFDMSYFWEDFYGDEVPENIVFYGLHDRDWDSVTATSSGYSPFTPGSLAAAIDRSLWATHHSILDKLADKTEQLTSAFFESIDLQRQIREERLQAVERSWGPEGDTIWNDPTAVWTRRIERMSKTELEMFGKIVGEALKQRE